MRRRDLLALLGAAAFIRSLPVCAQAAKKNWRLGVLSPIDIPLILNVVIPELARRGFVEGQNLVVDKRVGTEEQLPQLARELVNTSLDVIMAISDWAVDAARQASKSIPVIASPMGADPVTLGIAESWARPGGNVTGVTLIAPELEVKRLGYLREVVPTAKRIAMLSMHRKVTEPGEAPIRVAAGNSGIELLEFYIDEPDQIDEAFSAMRTADAEGLLIVPVPELNLRVEKLAQLAVESGLPTVCGFGRAANMGCLIGYGPDLAELLRVAADYVSRIFAGASAGELPFQGPTHYGFAVNLNTAKALGLSIPQSLLARADEVIE